MGTPSPRKGQRQIRLCKCGCGKPVKEIYTGSVFKGYSTVAAGCRRSGWDDERRRLWSENHSGLDNARALPLGTRRIHHINGKLEYWQIKVIETGRWVYEHRHVMEKHLGRKLSRKEHVHHIDGDSLNNALENLIVLSHSEHSKITDMYPKGPHKCPCCGLVHDPPPRSLHL